MWTSTTKLGGEVVPGSQHGLWVSICPVADLSAFQDSSAERRLGPSGGTGQQCVNRDRSCTLAEDGNFVWVAFVAISSASPLGRSAVPPNL